jgi:SAM-dependent methyltransferase
MAREAYHGLPATAPKEAPPVTAPTDWYANSLTTEIVDAPWTESTSREVDRLITTLKLTPDDRIVDLGCGYGRHSLELARRGFQVVGVDLSGDLIAQARERAERAGVAVELLQSDLRELRFEAEFDAAVNLFSGAIGYLENEQENRRLFEVVARLLRPGGRHLMHVPSIAYARAQFPRQFWEDGQRMVDLWEYEWDEATRTMQGTLYQIQRGRIFEGELRPVRYRQQLYEIDEIAAIWAELGMRVDRVVEEEPPMPSYDGFYVNVLSRKVGTQ